MWKLLKYPVGIYSLNKPAKICLCAAENCKSQMKSPPSLSLLKRKTPFTLESYNLHPVTLMSQHSALPGPCAEASAGLRTEELRGDG